MPNPMGGGNRRRGGRWVAAGWPWAEPTVWPHCLAFSSSSSSSSFLLFFFFFFFFLQLSLFVVRLTCVTQFLFFRSIFYLLFIIFLCVCVCVCVCVLSAASAHFFFPFFLSFLFIYFFLLFGFFLSPLIASSIRLLSTCVYSGRVGEKLRAGWRRRR